MWCDNLANTIFLRKLYKEVPALEDVRIASVVAGDEGNRISVVFDMPKYADHPPEKWEGCNTAIVETDFCGITKFHINTTSNTYRGDIRIEKNAEGLLEVSVKGNLELDITAEFGMIQNVRAYLMREENLREV